MADLTASIERSLKNLETEALDLVQLHSPPWEVYYMPEVFGILDDLVQAGKVVERQEFIHIRQYCLDAAYERLVFWRP